MDINELTAVSIGIGIGLTASIYEYLNEKSPFDDDHVFSDLRSDFKTISINLEKGTIEITRDQLKESMQMNVDLVRQCDPTGKIELAYTRKSCGGYTTTCYHYPTTIFMPIIDLFPRNEVLEKYPSIEPHLNVDPKAVLAHELGHAVDPNLRRVNLVYNFLQYPLAGGLAAYSHFHPGPAILGALAIKSGYILYRRQAEVKADLYACQLVGGERMARMFEIDKQKLLNSVPKMSLWDRTLMTIGGDSLLDIYHPSLSARIKYCREHNAVDTTGKI